MTVKKVGALGFLLSMAVAAPGAAQTVFGLTNDNRIVTFNATVPGAILSNSAITGLPTGSVLTGIDIRPATGEIYTLSTTGTVYRLAQSGSNYSAVSTGQLVNATGGAPVTPNGTNFGIDFNPVPDRLRLVGTTDQNLRINVTGGSTIVDGTISNTAGAQNFDLVGAGYTNSFAGTATTTLYGIDAATSSLVRSTDPNGGIYTNTNLAGVAFLPLGFALTSQPQVGFDILFSGGTNAAYLSANDTFYSVDLTSGLAMSLGTIGQSGIRGITLASAVPEPATWGMMILGVLGVGWSLRRRPRASLATT